ncbi:MAG: T9SS C-terminal target domain-containing protein [Cytophagales bacterium]|nr:MAG: T9SS C-terminal target domain-containing protein [Cytophagales bacterium]
MMKINTTLSISKFIWSIFLLLIFLSDVFAQYPVPATEDTTGFGRGIQRTMKLLATSTPQKRNTVKILVYGQSISHGTWWLNVKEDLQKRFPNANLIMENKAIGGFSSKELFRPFINDVLPYNYDLVLFHVYGSQWTYDSIVRNIRSFTTAEMALQNDHGSKGSDSWADQMSYTILPAFAQKYKLEMMDIRTPWTKYMSDNKFTMSDLTNDGIHLNDRGNYLIGTLISRHLAYKPKFQSDPYELLKVYEVGKDVFFSNSKLELDFEGTRVEFVSEENNPAPAQVRVMIDGKKPTDFIGCSFHLRANDSTEVPKYYENHPQNKAKRIDWPWNVGTLLRVRRGVPLVNEEWTVTINKLTKTSTTCSFDFTLVGSVTGNDGTGTVRMAKRSTSPDSSLYGWVGISPAFVSNSKRVVISSNDWYIPVALENNQPKVSPIVDGYQIKWQSKVEATSLYVAPPVKDPTIETTKVIAHGLPKGSHTMELSVVGGGGHGIKYIKIYNPYFDRPLPTSVNKSASPEAVISLFPNPATNQINIDLEQFTSSEVKIDVYTLLGSFVDSFKGAGSSKLTFDTSDLMAGMYQMNITLANGNVINKKFNVIK